MIVKCQQCEVTIDVKETVSKDFKYTCKKHIPESEENTAGISNTQFDERFRKGHWLPPAGFQMAYEACPYDTFVPEWAKTNEGIRKVILTAFPKYETNEIQYLRAQRWATVIYMFWRVQYTNTDIAEELGTTIEEVDLILKRARRVAANRRADTGKPRSDKRRGNAKKRSCPFRLS
jgi:hypothetical protein